MWISRAVPGGTGRRPESHTPTPASARGMPIGASGVSSGSRPSSRAEVVTVHSVTWTRRSTACCWRRHPSGSGRSPPTGTRRGGAWVAPPRTSGQCADPRRQGVDSSRWTRRGRRTGPPGPVLGYRGGRRRPRRGRGQGTPPHDHVPAEEGRSEPPNLGAEAGPGVGRREAVRRVRPRTDGLGRIGGSGGEHDEYGPVGRGGQGRAGAGTAPTALSSGTGADSGPRGVEPRPTRRPSRRVARVPVGRRASAWVCDPLELMSRSARTSLHRYHPSSTGGSAWRDVLNSIRVCDTKRTSSNKGS